MLALLIIMLLAGSSATAAGPVDLNTASLSELATLPGIGPSKAAAIVEYRSVHGQFRDVVDVNRVPGIGIATVRNLSGLAVVRGAPPPLAADFFEQTAYSPPPTVSPGSRVHQVDINTADLATLLTLPGVGAAKATTIIAHREEHGPFQSCEALRELPGFSEATVVAVREMCVIGAGPAARP